MRAISLHRQASEWDIPEYYTVPLKEAGYQFDMFCRSVPSNLDLPVVFKEIVHITLAAMLVIPILNAITYLALDALGLSVSSIEGAREEARLANLDAWVEQGDADEQRLEATRLEVRRSLEADLDAWVEQGNAGERRLEAKTRILQNFDNRGSSLDLSELGLRSLPPGLNTLRHLETLHLYRNQLQNLQQGTFAGLTNLRELYLHNNQLQNLPEALFAGLANLTMLHLEHNQLQNLQQGTLAGLANLEWLALSHNQLQNLPEALLAELTNLRSLWLSHNLLQNLPEALLAELTNLSSLWLSHNQLQNLPEALFAGLANLRQLRLQSNQLQNLPEDIFAGLANLEWLYLEHNQLQNLPEALFAELTNLRSLWLSHNLLQNLPEALFAGLANLRQLRLQSNQLQNLPEALFAGLANLRELHLEHNQLSGLPASFFDLPQDSQIGLFNNRFEQRHIDEIRHRVDGRFRVEHSIYEPPRLQQRDFDGYVEELLQAAESDARDAYPFTNEQKTTLVSFMHRIGNSKAYQDAEKPRTARLLLDCLDLAVNNVEFKGILFTVLNEASTSCGDRVALGINNCYIQYCLHTEFPDNMSVPDFVVGLKRLELLDRAAQAFIQDYRGVIDEIEVYLALQVKLREELRLPVFARDMLYFGCSALTEQDLEHIARGVVIETQDQEAILKENQTWRDHLCKRYEEEYTQLSNSFEVLMPAELEEEGGTRLSDQEYRDYCAQVERDRAEALTRFVEEKTELELQGVPAG